MRAYVVRRLLLMAPTLLLITVVVFVVLKAAPGNPFSAAQGTGEGSVKQMNPADYQALLGRYGLDKPWYVQYWRWLKGAVTGSFGDSFMERRPVADVFLGGAPQALGEGKPAAEVLHRLSSSPLGATLFLNLLSLAGLLIVAVPAGLHAAVRKGGWFDRASGALLYVLFALPNFWIAVLLILLFGVHLKLLPFIGMHSDWAENAGALKRFGDLLLHAFLPAVCITYGSLAFVARFTRGSLLEALGQEYVRAARAKGVGERAVLYRHALRNALLPLLTLLGLLLPGLVVGSIIVEQIFAWPGLGQLYVKAIYARDYPVIMAESLLGAVAVLLSNLLTDVAYSIADPRVRME